MMDQNIKEKKLRNLCLWELSKIFKHDFNSFLKLLLQGMTGKDEKTKAATIHALADIVAESRDLI